MKHAEKINSAHIRISTKIFFYFLSKIFPVLSGVQTGKFFLSLLTDKRKRLGTLGGMREIKDSGWWSTGFWEGHGDKSLSLSLPLCRSLLHPLLHLLLRLWHPGVLPGGGIGPVHQPRERHSLEEDLPPPPG